MPRKQKQIYVVYADDSEGVIRYSYAVVQDRDDPSRRMGVLPLSRLSPQDPCSRRYWEALICTLGATEFEVDGAVSPAQWSRLAPASRDSSVDERRCNSPCIQSPPAGVVDTTPCGDFRREPGEGILGEVIAIIARAAVHAATCGAEAISPRILVANDFIPPFERPRAAI
jgi:hypothetical protein